MKRRCLLTLLACLVCTVFASSQNTSSPEPIHITLGQSVVPLYGPWKFSVGDSPLDPATGAPLWAQSGFDDSKWETVDLTPKAGVFDPLGGFSGYVRGWTAHGHANHWGYGWYRIRVQVAAQPGEKLALAGPAYVDDAYQFFLDGGLIGSFGKFSGNSPTIYYTQPMMFPLPQAPVTDLRSAPKTLVLAFRVWMEPSTLVTQADSGGFHTAPTLGNASAVSAGYQLRWLELIRTQVIGAVEGLLFLLLAGVAFSLTRFDRSDPVFVWMGAIFLLIAASEATSVVAAWTQQIGALASNGLTDGILTPLIFGGWVMVWWIWFGLQRAAWVPKAVGVLTICSMISIAIGEDTFYPFISMPVADIFHTVSLAVRLALLVLLILVVAWGIRRQGGVEGWLVLPAVVLMIAWQFNIELALLHIRINWFPFGIRFGLAAFSNLLLTAVLFVLLFRRLLLSVREQRLMALDVKQAQEVQRVILPESMTTLPGLTIEHEYRPAREVGGDFYQIIPHPADGSLLIVAGDVTGKGLQAGMLVALLVGAIRSTSELNADPLFLLQALNRRLVGRREANATCMAMRIARDGAVILANAGHLPPYVNGRPVEIEGSLPLGVIAEAEFSVTQFRLRDNDRLVLASDGIAEAMDEHGHLFGFARVQELLEARMTASEVATAAQSFGQQDDISVIAVTRTAALVPA
ncbi:MAG: PP2C family protein-serine/threonine phosphatase [Acidobacteriaceae bacterium]